MKQKLFQQCKKIPPVATAHNAGTKYVFLTGSDTETGLTQFAFGKMKPGEKSGIHQHATMEEFFYFTKGNGVFQVGEIFFEVNAGSFIRIPANTIHELSAASHLQFTYFGIAV